MALRYWVRGNGTWNSTNTANWSATSGGLPGASVPTADDDVIFNAQSSGGTPYTVTCASTPATIGVCKSITTNPSIGNGITFAAGGANEFFRVFNGNISFLPATIFSGGGTITHTPTVAGAYIASLRLGSSGGINPSYIFTQADPTSVLSFLTNGGNVTFRSIDISVRTLFIGDTILTKEIGDASFSYVLGRGATTVEIGSRFIITEAFGDASSIIQIGDSTTTAWSIPASTSQMTIAMRNYSGGTTPQLLIGANSPVQPPRWGNLSFGGCNTTIWSRRANDLNLNSSTVRLLTDLTVDTIITTFTSSLVNPSFALTCRLANFNQTGSILSTSSSAVNTFTSFALFESGGVNGPTGLQLDVAAGRGTFIFQSVTFSGTATSNYLVADVVSAPSLSLTNTFVDIKTSLTVTSDILAYNINASADLLNVNRGPAFGFNKEYPSISIKSATVPSLALQGLPTRRVVYGQPRGAAKTVNDTLTISGGTPPTLTNVTFLGTTINNGTSNFSGTRLGTDGLSTGFLPAPGVDKFAVVPAFSLASFQSAIWALTNGGATSEDNYPLPQDTVIYSSTANQATITYTGAVHIGNIRMERSGATFLDGGNASGGAAYCFGDVPITTAGTAFTPYTLVLAQSGNTNRYLTNTLGSTALQPVQGGGVVLNVGSATTLTVSGQFGLVRNFFAQSGGIEYLEGVLVGQESLPLILCELSGGTSILRGTAITTNSFVIGSTATLPSSNYSVNLRTFSSLDLLYTNNNPGGALNGSISVLNPSSLLVRPVITGTTASNPLKSLSLTNEYNYFLKPILPLITDIYLEAFGMSGTNFGWTLSGGDGVRGFFKTNGGTASIADVSVNNVIASPPNTFYATGTSTLTGTTTGWTLGTPPASPSSGGFFMF